MDIVGTVGYSGQPIVFVSPERFAYISGNGLCIVDCNMGPREILWRSEKGINNFEVHQGNNLMALASRVDGDDIELINYPNHMQTILLRNPSTGKIIDMSFSRDGDRLLAISDATDHKVFMWDIVNRSILFCVDLPITVKKCSVNPADSSLIIISGEYGLLTGAVSEIMGEFTLKLEQIAIDPDITGADSGDDEVNMEVFALTQSNTICFSSWAPSNKVYIGNCQGYLLEVDVASKFVKPIGRIPQLNHSKSISIPSCAVLSTENLIVGTSDGIIYWFPTDKISSNSPTNRKLLSDSERNTESEKEIQLIPTQIVKLARYGVGNQQLQCLVTDPTYTDLIGGSAAGPLYHIHVQVQEAPKAEGTDEDALDLGEKIKNQEHVTLEITLEPSFDMHEGAVLCTKPLALPLSQVKGSPPSKSSELVSILITASHVGVVTFWRPASVEVDSATTSGLGVRRSVPRILRTLARLKVGSNNSNTITTSSNSNNSLSQITTTAAATVIEKFSLACKFGGRIIGVGTSDGWVEVWQVRALLVDEEEEGGEEEDGGILKLEVTKIVRRHVFRTPVTILASHETKPCVAIGSSKDDRIFIMSTTRAAKFQIVSYVSIGNSPTLSPPIYCIWSGILLWVGCHDGKLFTFQPHTEKSFENANPEEAVLARVAWDSNYKAVGNGFLTSAGGLVTFSPESLKLNILPSLPSMMELEQANLLHGETAHVPVLELPGALVESAEHSDNVITFARSPNGSFIAVGAADGSVYIWRCRRNELSFLNKLELHGAVVLSVCFNAESSLLMSCAADGSIFLTTVEKGTSLRSDPSTASAILDEEELKKLALNEERAMASSVGDKLWVEQKQSEAMDSLHDEYRGKSSELRATVQDLSNRLGVLLQRNEAAAELEKMDRSEFVVDLKGRDELLQMFDSDEQKIRESYHQQNLRNELIAARIRMACWDPMEKHSRRLLPLQPELAGKVSLSAYAVRKVAESQLEILSKVCRIRAVEMKAQRFHGKGTVNRVVSGSWRAAWTLATHGCPHNTSWIVNDGLHWPCADVVDMILQKEKAELEAPKAAAGGGTDKKESNAGHPEPAAAAANNLADDDDDASTGSIDLAEQEFDETNVFNLLYPPVAIRTQVQKRTQILLLNEVVRLIKIKFNEHFDNLAKEKEDVVQSIESRNARIKEILEELQLQESYFLPHWDDYEVKGSTIKVNDSEIVSRPYETEAAKQIRLLEEEEKKKRAADIDREDMKALALEEMMRGSLEVKRDVFAEASALKKPQWMLDKRIEEMNEAERKEVEEFEVKFKTLQEEQVKYRKSLELELKRLKSEVQDISKAFDEKLVGMSRLRMLTHREILSQELYMSRLACSMVRREHTWSNLKATESLIEESRKTRKELRLKIDKFSSQVDDEKTALQTIQEEERSMDKSFKRDIQNACNTNFDQESLKVYTQLFRMRQYADEDLSNDNDNDNEGGNDFNGSKSENNEANLKGSKNASSGSKGKKRGSFKRSLNTTEKSGSHRKSKMKSSGMGGLMGSKQSSGMGPLQEAAHALKHTEEKVQYLRDPFFITLAHIEKARKIADSQIPLLVPLSMEADCPEGFSIDPYTFSKLQELRTARINKEIEGKRLSIHYLDMKRKLDLLVTQENALIAQIETLKTTKENILSRLNDLESDLEVVVTIRQGQDEVDRDAAVTDYSDAILVPTDVVNKYNSRIYELGKDKTSVLSKIKQFRRKINLVDWEAQHLKLQTNHLEEYFTDLQLLRITRELQEVIRGGSDIDQSKARIEKINNRKDFLVKDSELKLAKLQKNIETLNRQLEERMNENIRLEDHIHSLKREVAARESVRQSRNDARGTVGDPAQTAMKKMKKVVVRRQLVDLARTQAEELDFLRQELDRMRQKTFPSFVKATRTRIGVNADER